MALTAEKRKLIQQLLGNRLEELSLPQGLRNEGMATSTPQPKKGGIEPSAFISEAGGLGGALAGGATGAAIGSVVPGIGTAIGGILGAGIGGFAGGFGGSAIEQQVRDDKVDTGKALREGLIEGVFAAGPLKLAKLGAAGAKIAVKGATKKAATRAGLSVADELSEALVSNVGKAGRSLTASSRGITAGQTLSGRRITPDTVNTLNKFLTDEVGVKAGSSAAQLDDVGRFIGSKSDELSQTVLAANRGLTKRDITGLVNRIKTRFGKDIIADPSQKQLANELLSRVKKIGSVAELDDLRKTLDEQINFARREASPLPLKEQVFTLFRRELTDEVSTKVPTSKALKSQLSKAYQAQELLLGSAARRGSGVSPAGISLPARAGQAVSSRAGRTLEKVGAAGESTSAKALAARVGAAGALNAEPAQQAQLQQGVPTEEDLLGGLTSDIEGATEQQSGGAISEEDINAAILADIQETGGKNVEAIQMIAELFGPKNETANLGAVERRGVAGAETAQSIVDELEGLFQQAGGAKGRIGGTVAKGAGLAGLDSQTQAFANARGGYLARIVRAMGEVGTLNEGDIQRAIKLIPDITATPEEAAIGFESIRRILEESKQALLRTAKQ